MCGNVKKRGGEKGRKRKDQIEGPEEEGVGNRPCKKEIVRGGSVGKKKEERLRAWKKKTSG